MKEPWRQWLSLGLGVMGLAPDVFWGLSLAEWQAMAEGHALRLARPGRDLPLERRELTDLLAHYPDKDGHG